MLIRVIRAAELGCTDQLSILGEMHLSSKKNLLLLPQRAKQGRILIESRESKLRLESIRLLEPFANVEKNNGFLCLANPQCNFLQFQNPLSAWVTYAHIVATFWSLLEMLLLIKTRLSRCCAGALD